MRNDSRSLCGIAAVALLAAFAATPGFGQTGSSSPSREGLPRQEQARVLSSSPIVDEGRTVGYSVRYQVDGREYVTRTEAPPGPTIAIQRSDYGVTTAATSTPVAAQSIARPQPLDTEAPWRDAVPEAGVVVSAGAPPALPQPYAVAPVYTAPVYAAPVYAAPVYVQPSYYWPQPYVYPPVGISLSLGYSRGWYGGGYRGGYGRYRGGYRGWR